MSLKVVPFKSLGAVSYSAVLSKQTVTAIFAKNEIRAFYGSLCCYLTMWHVQSKKAVSALQTGINHDTNKPYLQNSHAVSARKP